MKKDIDIKRKRIYIPSNIDFNEEYGKAYKFMVNTEENLIYLEALFLNSSRASLAYEEVYKNYIQYEPEYIFYLNDLRILKKAINILNHEEKRLIYLLFFKNLTEKEAALILNITQQAINKKKFKIIKKLRKYFFFYEKYR